MSNKKRISKRIKKIENKKLLNFYFRFAKSANAAESAAVSFLAFVNGVDIVISKIQDAKEKFVGTAKLFPQHQMGIDFAVNILTTGESLSFINDVRALTGIDDMESKVTLAKMPEHTKIPLLELLKVGYNLNDAYELIKDTFKF